VRDSRIPGWRVLLMGTLAVTVDRFFAGIIAASVVEIRAARERVTTNVTIFMIVWASFWIGPGRKWALPLPVIQVTNAPAEPRGIRAFGLRGPSPPDAATSGRLG
jgi:hypothetical protein